MPTLILKMIALLLAALCLAIAIVRVPLLLFDRMTWIQVLTGLAPYLFLCGEMVGRYSSASLAMGGSFGLLALGRDYLECRMGRPDCFERSWPAETIAILCYGIALTVGAVWLRKFPNAADRSGGSKPANEENG